MCDRYFSSISNDSFVFYLYSEAIVMPKFLRLDNKIIDLEAIIGIDNISDEKINGLIIHFVNPNTKLTVKTPQNKPNEEYIEFIGEVMDYVEENTYKREV